MTKFKITAQVVLINKEGLVLGVSRKTNHKDMGLPGGKEEPEDGEAPTLTAYRETLEETGIKCSNFRLVLAIHKDGYMSYTYLADYEGEINHNEPHVVKWVPFKELIDGSFGKYNKLVSESLTDMGIKYTMYPKSKKEYIFAVLTDDFHDYPTICFSTVENWKNDGSCFDLYNEEQSDDIMNTLWNHDMNVGELDETSFEVTKANKIISTKEEIIKNMVEAGFVFNEEFDKEMNS